MKTNVIILILMFIIPFFLAEDLNFSKDLQYKDLLTEKEYKYIAKYEKKSGYNYLYIFPKNLEKKTPSNKSVLKIYFKLLSDTDSEDSNPNYLDSEYSSIDFNSGLFIEISQLSSEKAIVFVKSYQSIYLRLYYQYTNEINFPSSYPYSNFQLNQFILKKGATIPIRYSFAHLDNDYLFILSKTSLRNIEVTVKYANNIVTEDKLCYLYPNGFSVFIDKSKLDYSYMYIDFTINNKKNVRDEVILLGYAHHKSDETFPNDIVNGFQLYLEGNSNELGDLPFPYNANQKKYLISQTSSKSIYLNYLNSNGVSKDSYTINEYNSAFPFTPTFEGSIRFRFLGTPLRTSLYMQNIDYSEPDVAQKSLQPLVTGLPKSMIIPGKNSMYHFLPKERSSDKLYYYLRSKTQQKLFVSFESCTSYPEGCSFLEKNENSVEAIQNIGLWYTVPRKNDELQPINIYCENECSYDIIMTYEEKDPLFLFPDNNYTKFISESGEDIFTLPIFEYFETSNVKSLYIDLIVLSGKADLELKDASGNNICNIKKLRNKQSCVLTSAEFLKEDNNYFKKEIFAYVKQSSNYKNTFYNIIYGNSEDDAKPLSNYIIHNELMTVPETKIFKFVNQKTLYISISTQICQSKITIDKTLKLTDYNHLYQLNAGSHSVQIDLINDGALCQANTEESVVIFTYDDNSEVLLSENSLINTTISSTFSFLHLFKPNEDNSFNLDIEKYDANDLSLSYQIKKISFDGNSEASDISGHKLSSFKSKYISNKQIKKYCGKLSENEVCSLTMTFNPKATPSQISLNLINNGIYKARELIDKSLIGSVNSKTAQYFYIDVDKSSNLELLINSYGQDLKFNYQISNKKQEDESILPLKTTYKTDHQYAIKSSDFKDCSDFCRLYIGVASQVSAGDDVSSPFYIGYRQESESKNVFNLPLNYFTQYTLNKGNEVSFYVSNPTNSATLIFELYTIMQKEDDTSAVTAEFSGAVTSFQLSTNEKKTTTSSQGIINIKVKINDETEKVTFKLRVSSIEGKGIIPMISSYGEKCLEKTCYYLVDDLSMDNEEKSAYFYIPDSETSVIQYLSLKYDEEISTTGKFIPSTGGMNRPNWLQLDIPDKEHFLILKTENIENIIPSYYNKPNEVTLNYGEKRMFTIRKGSQDTMKIKINRLTTDNYKYKINLHSIMGNGVFKSQGQNYPLGFENSYKEDISIIFINDKKFDMDLEVVNRRYEKVDNNNDFVFSIEYAIETGNYIIYPITFDKMNSFNFYKSAGIGEFSFYLDRNEITSKGLDMNIKIYSSSYYDINSYFADSDKNCKIESNDLDNKIKTFIQGAGFTFSKLEVTSDILEKNAIKDYPYIYIQIKSKESSGASNSVKIDLYPYDMINTNHILARDELYIQKLPSNTLDYQLFLGKSEINYGDDAKIYYIHPLSDKYNNAIAQTDDGQKTIKEDELDLVSLSPDEKYGFDKYILDLGTNKIQKYISFNIYTDKDNQESNEDSFIFSYQNPRNGEDYLYRPEKLEFNVTGKEKSLEFGVIGFKPKYETTGTNIFIVNAYKEDDVKNCLKLGDDYLSLYLLFNKKPAYTIYQELILNSETGTKKTIQDNKIKAGQYYFTGVSVLKDNGREQYIGYPGKSYKVEGSNKFGELLDYMKEHVLASVLIIIIILFILGIMVNICRAERKGGRVSSVKVELDGQLMDDKA